jgi:glycosyltransferase involved in cell wall biosynthesis
MDPLAERPRLLFVVESGTDVRLVEGFARRFRLEVLAREIPGGVAINRVSSLPFELTIGPSSRTRFAALVVRRLTSGRNAPDLVVVQGYSLAALATNLAGNRRGIPVLMLVCSPIEVYYACRREAADPAKPFRYREYLGLQVLARLNAKVAAGYVVLSEYLATVVRSHGWNGPTHVIPLYGVDLERFTPARVSPSVLRGKLGLPTTGRLIFFSSRVAPEKDSRTVLEAVRELRAEGQDVWLINRSGGFKEFGALAQIVGVPDRVIIGDAVHPQQELPELYQASDVCVQASRAEGLGFSPLEALACGTPVIATAVGGLQETIIPGRTGWTYRRGDPRDLARSLREVFADPSEADRLVREGRQVVVERFAQEKVFDAFGRMAHTLLGASRSSARAPEAGLDARGSEPDLRE